MRWVGDGGGGWGLGLGMGERSLSKESVIGVRMGLDGSLYQVVCVTRVERIGWMVNNDYTRVWV